MKLPKSLFLLFLMLSFYAVNAKTADTLFVYFDVNVHVLSASENEKLSGFVATLSVDKISAINIRGYADSTGNAESNLALSQKRMEYVKDFLQKKIPSTSITYKTEAKGESIKYGSDLSKNRCVKIVFVYADNSEKLSRNISNIKSYKKGDKIVLDNILFENNTHNLLTSSFPTLKKLAEILLANPSVNIEIQGHVCCGGNNKNYDMEDLTEPGMKISEARAKAVYDYLVSNGILKSRLKFKGMSFTSPLIFPEVSEADRQKNRRVEIEIL